VAPLGGPALARSPASGSLPVAPAVHPGAPPASALLQARPDLRPTDPRHLRERERPALWLRRLVGRQQLARLLAQPPHLVLCHPLPDPAAGLVGVATHREVRAGRRRVGEAGDVHAVGFQGPEQRGLHLAGMVAGALAATIEAGLVGLEVGEAVEAHGDVGLEQVEEDPEVLPVGAVVAGEEERGVEAEGIGGAHVVGDAFEVPSAIFQFRKGRSPAQCQLVLAVNGRTRVRIAVKGARGGNLYQEPGRSKV
jgi:hypothetical protein